MQKPNTELTISKDHLLTVALSTGARRDVFLRDVVMITSGVEDSAPDLDLHLISGHTVRVPNPTDDEAEWVRDSWVEARSRG